jgi:hypothetical protein
MFPGPNNFPDELPDIPSQLKALIENEVHSMPAANIDLSDFDKTVRWLQIFPKTIKRIVFDYKTIHEYRSRILEMMPEKLKDRDPRTLGMSDLLPYKDVGEEIEVMLVRQDVIEKSLTRVLASFGLVNSNFEFAYDDEIVFNENDSQEVRQIKERKAESRKLEPDWDAMLNWYDYWYDNVRDAKNDIPDPWFTQGDFAEEVQAEFMDIGKEELMRRIMGAIQEPLLTKLARKYMSLTYIDEEDDEFEDTDGDGGLDDLEDDDIDFNPNEN